MKLETPEDFELMREALNDAEKHITGGNKAGIKRKYRQA